MGRTDEKELRGRVGQLEGERSSAFGDLADRLARAISGEARERERGDRLEKQLAVERTGRTFDPELARMESCCQLIDQLEDPGARQRVAAYLGARYHALGGVTVRVGEDSRLRLADARNGVANVAEEPATMDPRPFSERIGARERLRGVHPSPGLA